MKPTHARPTVPAIALLVLALAACRAERAPQVGDGSASPAPSADAMAGDPAAPPPLDQPVEDVPPATAPAGVNQAPDLGLVRMDGYGDMRFGMSADEAKQAWDGELEVPGDATAACHYLVPKWVSVPSDFAFMIEDDTFVRYDVGTGREVAPGGGKVGMAAGEVRDLYAGRIKETPHKYVEGGHYLRVDDINGSAGKLVFETDGDGKVTAWRVGVPPQVDYVEGCS